MPRDSAATRARILDAAIEEFSAYGLAGARVDRIAEAAGANKRSIYVYFEHKEGLFAAALHRVIGTMAEAVPVTEDDLPDYAGRMFDYLQEHPQAARMSAWRQLERPDSGPSDGPLFTSKVEAMQRSPVDVGLPPTDLIVLVIGLAVAWLNSPLDLLRADGSDPHSPVRIAVHRAALVEAARRVCTPP